MRAKCSSSVLLVCGEVLSAVLVFSLGSMLALPVQAQTVDFPEDFSKRMIATSQVKGLNTGLAGNEANLYSGSLGFTQNDIPVPGHSGLPVELTRRLSTGQGSDGFRGFFANWGLETTRCLAVMVDGHGHRHPAMNTAAMRAGA